MQVIVLSLSWRTMPLFLCAERVLRSSAGSRARVRCNGRKQLPQKRLGNVQKSGILHI